MEWGGELGFRKKFNHIFSVKFGYMALWSDILEVEEGIDDTEKGLSFFSSFKQKLIINLRDNPTYPTSGSYHFIEWEESLTAIGSDVDYIKFYAHTAWYFHLWSRWVLSFALRGGVIVPFNDTEQIPIQRRYFSGGINSIRSFKEKQLPPLDSSDNPIGGEGIFLFSTELRIPIYENFGTSLFFDTGQIIPIVRRFSDYRIDHLKYAVGFSLWYNTPIGPIGLDIGFNPDRETTPSGDKEALFAWYLAVGFTF